MQRETLHKGLVIKLLTDYSNVSRRYMGHS